MSPRFSSARPCLSSSRLKRAIGMPACTVAFEEPHELTCREPERLRGSRVTAFSGGKRIKNSRDDERIRMIALVDGKFALAPVLQKFGGQRRLSEIKRRPVIQSDAFPQPANGPPTVLRQ